MDEEKYVCVNCVDDQIVKQQIEELSFEASCHYCSQRALVVEIDILAGWLDPVYRSYFCPASDYSTFFAEFYEAGDTPEYIIGIILQADNDQLCVDIRDTLSCKENRDVSQGADAMYESANSYIASNLDIEHHSMLWDDFCRIIKHESRFFSWEAQDLLKGIFSNLEGYLTNSGDSFISVQPFPKIYRARRANTPSEILRIAKDPDNELFAPPATAATSGRMNAHGITIFYGALDQNTCLAELRLVTGETAVCGQFSGSRPLKVFDFTKLKNIDSDLSFFDPQFAEKSSQISFLRKFEDIISRPVLPGSESLEYLPTQAVTEYLLRFVAKGIDAIIFASSQTEGKNIAVVVNPLNTKEIDFIDEAPRLLAFVKETVSIHRITAVNYKWDKLLLPIVELESLGDEPADSF